MAVSPSASAKLYRKGRVAVILLSAGLLLAHFAAAQSKTPAKKVKGPRALALLELAPNGGAHLVPVAILIDGQFYDAGAYKASPVPMALDTGTVYEGERTGTSLGLFTVSGATQGPNNTWDGSGRWIPAGSKPAGTAHHTESKPRDLDQEDGAPVLRRRHPREPAPDASTPAAPASAPVTPAPAAPSSSTPAPTASAPSAPPATPSSTPAASAAPETPSAAEAAEEADADRPVLQRGKPKPQKAATVSKSSSGAAPGHGKASPGISAPKAATAAIQTIPAISDAGGPEPHSYAFVMKPEDEQQFRKKILVIAAQEITDRAKQLTPAAPTPTTSSKTPARRAATAAKRPQPIFDDVQLRVVDPSSSNEPILILTATGRIPAMHREGSADVQYLLTLVMRQDIYGDLHKVFSNVTDAQHLDVLPRYDFIDVVDADGDGRGELLFRKVSDSGSAFVIDRVIGNQLWPLFDGSQG